MFLIAIDFDILTFYLKKGQKKMVCNRIFSRKKIVFVSEFLTSQDEKFQDNTPNQFSNHFYNINL